MDGQAMVPRIYDSGGNGAISCRSGGISGGVIGDGIYGKYGVGSDRDSGGSTSVFNGNGDSSIPNRQ